MLLVNISREKIILQGKGFTRELEYIDVERKLAPLLLDTIHEYAPQTIWVINGPGSFTTLRLGCLTLMTIKQFGDVELSYLSCTKLDIYQYALHNGFLPDKGIIYIGQKKNMRESMVHRGVWEHSIITGDSCTSLEAQEYFIDPCEHILVDILGKDRVVDWRFDGTKLTLSYRDALLHILPSYLSLAPVDILEPAYLMDPQIG